MKKLLIILLLVPVFVNGQNLLLRNNAGKVLSFGNLGITISPYNNLALSLFSRMPVQPSLARKEIISTVYDTLEAYGIYDESYSIYFTAAHDSVAANLNWISDNYNLTNLDGKSYFDQDIGYWGNNISAEINTNFNPLSAGVLQNDFAMGVYALDSYEEDDYMIGGRSTLASSSLRLRRWGSVGALLNSTGFVTAGINYDAKGLYVVDRNNASNIQFYKNGNLHYSKTLASSSVVDNDIYFLCKNNLGTADDHTCNRMAFGILSKKLTALQHEKLASIVDWYMTQVSAKNSPNLFYSNGISAGFYAYNGYNVDFQVMYSDENKIFGWWKDTLYVTINSNNYKLKWDSTAFIAKGTSVIFDDNTILFCTVDNKVKVSYDSLQTLETIPLLGLDNNPYVFATSNPYFINVLGQPSLGSADGASVAFWGNYTADAIEKNFYYSADSGKTLRVAYTIETDTVTHIHSTGYNNFDESFWGFCGDGVLKNRWYKADYDRGLDEWTFIKPVSDSSLVQTEDYRNIGNYFVEDTIYWASDINNGKVFKCASAEVNDTSKHIFLYSKDPVDAAYSLLGDGNNIYVCWNTGNIISVSNDRGLTWVDVELSFMDNFVNNAVMSSDGYVIMTNNSNRFIRVKIDN